MYVIQSKYYPSLNISPKILMRLLKENYRSKKILKFYHI